METGTERTAQPRYGDTRPTDRVVYVPETESRSDERRGDIDRRYEVDLRRDGWPWIAATLGVISILLATAVVIAVTRRPVVVATSPVSGIVLPTTDVPVVALTTTPATVSTASGQDVLALARASTIVGLTGQPVTATGPAVVRVFADEAFSVGSSTGVELLVFVPDVEPSSLLNLKPGDRLVFTGTVVSSPSDLTGLLPTDALTLANQTGGYILASAGSIRIV